MVGDKNSCVKNMLSGREGRERQKWKRSAREEGTEGDNEEEDRRGNAHYCKIGGGGNGSHHI